MKKLPDHDSLRRRRVQRPKSRKALKGIDEGVRRAITWTAELAADVIMELHGTFPDAPHDICMEVRADIIHQLEGRVRILADMLSDPSSEEADRLVARARSTAHQRLDAWASEQTGARS